MPALPRQPSRPELLTLCEAAAALDVSPSTLRRWCDDEGAPVARRGRKGKNGAGLYDVAAIRAWRAREPSDTDDVKTYAQLIVDPLKLIADASWTQFCSTTGPHKHQLAGELAAIGFRVLAALEDLGMTDVPMPPEITRLRLIAQQK